MTGGGRPARTTTTTTGGDGERTATGGVNRGRRCLLLT